MKMKREKSAEAVARQRLDREYAAAHKCWLRLGLAERKAWQAMVMNAYSSQADLLQLHSVPGFDDLYKIASQGTTIAARRKAMAKVIAIVNAFIATGMAPEDV